MAKITLEKLAGWMQESFTALTEVMDQRFTNLSKDMNRQFTEVRQEIEEIKLKLDNKANKFELKNLEKRFDDHLNKYH